VGFLHQPIKAAGAIEQGILGVQMQMDKVSVRHVSILKRDGGSASKVSRRIKTRGYDWIFGGVFLREGITVKTRPRSKDNGRIFIGQCIRIISAWANVCAGTVLVAPEFISSDRNTVKN
jgi:hypothetical protein